jgi:hypothetical protein
VLSISRNSKLLFCVGVLSSAVQCVFLREYLSVFSGNEFIIGIVLATWLCFTCAGSLWEGRGKKDPGILQKNLLLAGLVVFTASGIFFIRASRLLTAHGQMIGPIMTLLTLIASESPFAFVSGYSFGALSRKAPPVQSRPAACGSDIQKQEIKNPYGLESFGALFGALLTFVGILLNASNVIIVASASAPCIVMVRKNQTLLMVCIGAISTLFFLNAPTLHWKYPFPFSSISYGQEGEIVTLRQMGDTSVILNGTLYTSNAQKHVMEQAVHMPLAIRAVPKNVLVIFDKGHIRELKKYPETHVDCIESEPRLASLGSVVASPETFQYHKRYDAIFLGTGMPQTAATGRFYTVFFFNKMKALLSDSGIFSFTLPFSENYLSTTERNLLDILKSTLNKSFQNVLIFPGEGYTFMASEKVVAMPIRPRCKTDYLESSILPAVSQERIAAANAKSLGTIINTAQRPTSLLFGIKLWTDIYGRQCFFIAVFFLVFLGALFAALPKSREVFSLGSTGLAVGTYSIALLLLYQSSYGLLYSRVSLFFGFLTCGFICGTRVRRLPFSDFFIGLFCPLTLWVLSVVSYPPAPLFYCAHLGIGVLAGAQFVSMKKISAGTLYAADCVGGAMGMAFSIAGIALFGSVNVAIGLCALKWLVWLYGVIRK